jgi:hypothetical protein
MGRINPKSEQGRLIHKIVEPLVSAAIPGKE